MQQYPVTVTIPAGPKDTAEDFADKFGGWVRRAGLTRWNVEVVCQDERQFRTVVTEAAQLPDVP